MEEVAADPDHKEGRVRTSEKQLCQEPRTHDPESPPSWLPCHRPEDSRPCPDTCPHPPGPLVIASLQLLRDPSHPCVDTEDPPCAPSLVPAVRLPAAPVLLNQGCGWIGRWCRELSPRTASPHSPHQPWPPQGPSDNTASVPHSSRQSPTVNTPLCTGSLADKVVCAFTAVS